MMHFRASLTLLTCAALAACSNSAGNPVAPVVAAGADSSGRSASAHIAASGANVVVNGSFQTGTLSGWTSVGTGSGAAKISTAAYSGDSYAMFVGTTSSPEVNGMYGLEQSVTVPAGGTLSMEVRGISDDAVKYAYEEATLINASGTVVDTCFQALFDTYTWQSETCNVSAFAGQTLTLFVGIVGNGYSSTYLDAWYDNISLTGSGSATPTPTPSPAQSPTATPTATATPTPTPTPTSSSKPTATPTATATAKPTATPVATPTATPTPSGAYPIDPGPFTVVPESTFENVITNGKNIVFSTFLLEPTSTLEQALVNAASGGASVEVSLPSDSYVQSLGDVYQEDEQSATNIENAGGTVLWDAGTQSPNNEPLHAKLAIVDGTAYLDGRNWDSGDVILSETGAADLTAIGNAISLNPTDSPYLDTVKQDALSLESTFITDTAGSTVDFMTESFGAGNVANALIARAKAGAAVHVIVLQEDLSSSEETTLTTMQNDGIDVELNPGSGSEKMTIIGSTAWFGSTNATTGSPYQIDWGAVFNQASVISTLQSNFNAVLATCTKYTGS